MAGARGLRVIAGEAGGLRLVAPKGARTRPTADRVKESLFSALADRFAGATVLDLYAGSGALGIEAVSRGAAAAVLVDRDRSAITAIRANLDSTRLGDRARAVHRPVQAFVRTDPPPEAPFDLVFLDPPYEETDSALAGVLERLATPPWSAPGTAAVLERAAGSAVRPPPPGWPGLPAGWVVTWERTSGGTLVTILSRPVV